MKIGSFWIFSAPLFSQDTYIIFSSVPKWYNFISISQCLFSYGTWLSSHLFRSLHIFSPRRAVVSYWRKYVHEVLVNRLGGLSLPRKSVVRLTDRPDMTLDVYHGRKTTNQSINQSITSFLKWRLFSHFIPTAMNLWHQTVKKSLKLSLNVNYIVNICVHKNNSNLKFIPFSSIWRFLWSCV